MFDVWLHPVWIIDVRFGLCPFRKLHVVARIGEIWEFVIDLRDESMRKLRIVFGLCSFRKFFFDAELLEYRVEFVSVWDFLFGKSFLCVGYDAVGKCFVFTWFSETRLGSFCLRI